MKLNTWQALADINEKSLKNMVAPCNKELFHLQLTAYSTALAVGIVITLFEQMEHTPEMDNVVEQYEDDYNKILKRIEGLV